MSLRRLKFVFPVTSAYVMANFSFGSVSGFTDIQAAWTSGPATRTALSKLSLNQPNLVRVQLGVTLHVL